MGFSSNLQIACLEVHNCPWQRMIVDINQEEQSCFFFPQSAQWQHIFSIIFSPNSQHMAKLILSNKEKPPMRVACSLFSHFSHNTSAYKK
jgi:hypothetical protein